MFGEPSSPSYRPDEVEGLLQQGKVDIAVSVGWFGDDWTFRLVQNAAGGTLETLAISISPYSVGTDLGLDLSNDDGVATVASVSPTGAVGVDGRLAAGDIVRTVNGQTLFTCEAVVRAIKNARGAPLSIHAVRPPPAQCWRDDDLRLRAGSQHTVSFEVSAPGACFAFRWQARALDVGFYVVRLGSKAEGSTSRHQHTIFEKREPKGSGQVLLPHPGRYLATFDNTYSVLRSKSLRFLLRLVPLTAWEAGRQLERLANLEAECEQCKARSKQLHAQIAAEEGRALELETQLAASKAAAEALRTEHEENKVSWRAAKAERDSLVAARRESLDGVTHSSPSQLAPRLTR